MSLKTESRVIEGLSITCTQMPAMRSYSVFARLGKVLGPAIGALAGVDTEGGVENMDAQELAPALSALLGGLVDDEPLALALLQGMSVNANGAEILITDAAKVDLAFSGNFKAMLLALKFSLEVNYADFFVGGLAALQNQKAKPAND